MKYKYLILLALCGTSTVWPLSVPVQKGGLEKPYAIVGNLAPIHETKLGTQVGGRVKNVFVHMGERIKKGQILIELDTVFLDIEMKRMSALLDLAKAGYEEAFMDIERIRPLWEKNPPSVSKKSFEDAEIRCKQRKAQLDQATADYENTQLRIKEMKIVAPYDCVIVKRNVDFGEAVTTMPAVTVAEIMDDSQLLFEFSLPQDLVEKVDIQNTKVILDIASLNQKFESTISALCPQLEKETRTFNCQVIIDNRDGKIHPGTFVRGTVYCKGSSDHFHAPKAAFVEQSGKWFARVQGSDGAILKPVDVCLMTDSNVEVAKGLQESDLLIIETKNE